MLTKKYLTIVDCSLAGVSGDMFISALLDLGADEGKVIEAMENTASLFKECQKVKINVEKTDKKGIKAKKLSIKILEEEGEGSKGIEMVGKVKEALDEANLSGKAKVLAVETLKTLLEAESIVHGKKMGEVELHEMGGVDTVLDIVGTFTALDDLNILEGKVFGTPVAVGRGSVKVHHGIYPVPAPATVEILTSRNYPFHGGFVQRELATPTGASILVNLVEKVSPSYPLIKPFKVGYGAGQMDFEEVPNVLRIIFGEEIRSLFVDRKVLLETNIDDVSGEVLGNLFRKVSREGLLDLCLLPMLTKKNRPGYVLKAVVEEDKAAYFSELIMRETGTLGVRVSSCERFVLRRDTLKLKINFKGVEAEVRVKVARNERGEVVRVKPEFEDLKRLAEKMNTSILNIKILVYKKLVEEFNGELSLFKGKK